MKTRLCIYFLFCFFLGMTGIKAQEGELYQKVERMPEFPGGQVALVKYLSKNIKYPARAKADSISGRVLVSFVVDKSGAVKDPKIVKSLHADCDEEALRVVRSMPQWTPGEKNGEKVDVLFTLPIQFEAN